MKLLLDEHLEPEIVAALHRRFPQVDTQSVHDPGWAGLDDPTLLEVLDADGRVLVTRDVSSIPEHLRERQANGLTHGGVVFVPRAIAQTDRRTVIRRVLRLLEQESERDWRCRVFWL